MNKSVPTHSQGSSGILWDISGAFWLENLCLWQIEQWLIITSMSLSILGQYATWRALLLVFFNTKVCCVEFLQEVFPHVGRYNQPISFED